MKTGHPGHPSKGRSEFPSSLGYFVLFFVEGQFYMSEKTRIYVHVDHALSRSINPA